MMINDEKAPAFSAKTLNLPTPPDDLSSRIIALSRERYAQDRDVVEQLVRRNAGLAIDAAAEAPKLPPPKPKVQHQIDSLKVMDDQAAKNEVLKKAVGANILQALEPAVSVTEGPSEIKKRRRGKRGGRKHKKTGAPISTSPVVVNQSAKSDEEQIIHLR
jgi:hypothetical protein